MSIKQIGYMSAGLFIWLMNLTGFIRNYVILSYEINDFRTFSLFILSGLWLSIMTSILLDMIIFAFKDRREECPKKRYR